MAKYTKNLSNNSSVKLRMNFQRFSHPLFSNQNFQLDPFTSNFWEIIKVKFGDISLLFI